MTLDPNAKKFGEGPKTVILNFTVLSNRIDSLSMLVRSMVLSIQSKKSAMSIADMFDVQAAMNKLSQFTEAASSLIAGLNSMANQVSRNIKG